MSASKISVIIPCFNEVQSIGKVLEKLTQSLDLNHYEIIVVNDGSTDLSAQIIKSFSQITIIEHEENKGYGASIRSASLYCKGKYLIWFDSDGQHQIEDLIKLSVELEKCDLDFIIGERDQNSHEVFNRRFGKAILRVVVRIAAGRLVKDYNCGLRGFKKSVLTRYLHLIPNGFGASTTTTLLMLERNYKGKFVSVRTVAREGQSTVRQFRDGFNTIMLVMRIFLLFKPMLFFGWVGVISIIMGLVYGFWEAFSQRLGFPILAAAVIIFGFQSLFFGLLCDQISGIRRERMEDK
jgi:glycosyltransferase involved in cell wall biosynthesis